MKKVFLKAGACLLAASVFFNSIFVHPVYAVIGVDDIISAIIIGGATALGTKLGENAIDYFSDALGWKQSDIQFDENGNVILSEEQMNEIKEAIKEYTQDAGGNDKYGMWLYSGTGELTSDFNTIVYGKHTNTALADEYIASGTWWADLYLYKDGYIQGVVDMNTRMLVNHDDQVWIGTSDALRYLKFYRDDGTGISVNLHGLDLYCISNGSWNWHGYGKGSTTSTDQYYGDPHVVFETVTDYAEWKSDGEPYTLVSPTYTGGTFTIPADHFKDTDGDGIPDDEDDDDDGDGIPDDEDDTPKGDEDEEDPSGGGSSGDTDEDEGTVLEQILTYVKKIYNQVIVGNIINAVDAVAQVLDTAKDYMDEALQDTASIAELGDALMIKFPFSLPSTLLALVTVFEAEPVAPVFEVPFKIDSGVHIEETFTIDFSQFDTVIDVLQWFMRIMYLYGLIKLTPHFIDVGGVTSGEGGGGS